MNLYNLRITAPDKFQMAKFDADFNVEAVYDLEAKGHSYTCNCPANNRTVITKPCKHKRMLPLMLGAVNTDRFFNPDTGAWCQPLGDIERPQADEIEGREALPDVHVAGEARLVTPSCTLIEGEMLKQALAEEPPIDGANEIPLLQYDAKADEVRAITPTQLIASAQPSAIRRR